MNLRLICLLGALCLAPPAQAQQSPPAGAVRAPFELTRSLQALQDQVALGNIAAHEAQRRLLQHTGEQFLAADPAVWSDLRNARAAVVFVLSGGSPSTFAELHKQGRLAGLDARLVEGALAYAEGREQDARASLKELDPKGLPPSLGGNVALVKATLAMEAEPKAAIPLLETARLLMPGTLVEEAALRREVFVAGNIGELKLFRSLALQYMRRFGGSVYAVAFRQQLTTVLTQTAIADTAGLGALEDLVSRLGDEDQRAVRLSLARSALAAGDLLAARGASAKALAMAAEGSPDHARARLYEAASQIASGEVEPATKALEALNSQTLPPDDARLREAALAVAHQVRKRPEGMPPPAEPAPTASAEAGAAPLQTATMKKAEQALVAADALLGRNAE